MRSVLLFSLILVAFCRKAEGDGKNNINYKDHEEYVKVNSDYYGKNNKEEYNKVYYVNSEEGYIGNPDDFAKIERPCQVYDLYCIRKFFASHAKCKITNGPLPDPVERTSLETFYISHANITVVIPFQRIDGLRNARIEEFYVNKATNKVVFSINVRNLLQSNPTLYYLFNRRARESIVGSSGAFVFYPSITYTAVIPNIEDLRLGESEITAYGDDMVTPFGVWPEALANADATAVAEFLVFASNPALNVQELQLTDSNYFITLYIQSNICDFGLKF